MTILCAGYGDPDFSNLVRNGSFVGHINGWWPQADLPDTSVAHSTTAHTPGRGSIRVSTALAGSTHATYRPGGVAGIPLNGLTTLDAVAYARASGAGATARVLAQFYSGTTFLTMGDQAIVPDPAVDLTAGVWAEVAGRDIAVPVGATHVRLSLLGFVTGDNDHILFSDVYLGPPGGEREGYSPATNALPTNRVINGTFASGIDGWGPWWGDETLTHDAGALKVETTEAGMGTYYPPSDELMVIGGENLRLTVRARGTGGMSVYLDWIGDAAVSDQALDPVALTPTAQTFTFDIAVPPTVRQLIFAFLTAEAEGATFWIDDVTLTADPA